MNSEMKGADESIRTLSYVGRSPGSVDTSGDARPTDAHGAVGMTLEEFLELPEDVQRKMSAKEKGPFIAQMFVRNLNANVLEEDRRIKRESSMSPAARPVSASNPACPVVLSDDTGASSPVKSVSETNWQAVALAYRERLHTLCVIAAFAVYVASGLLLASVLDWLRIDSVWVETIGMVAWIPLGFLAFYLKNLLEDWIDRSANYSPR